MKFDKHDTKLGTNNLRAVQEHLKAGSAGTIYQGALCVIADAIDRAVGGADTYVVIGLTKDRSALLLTVREGASVARAGGATFADISLDAERLL